MIVAPEIWAFVVNSRILGWILGASWLAYRSFP